jgi:hypothetical protein
MSEAYKSYGTALTTASATTVYDPPTSAIVNAINVANVDPANSAVTVTLRKNGTPYRIIKDALVPTQAAFQVLDAPLPLDAADDIQVTAAHANRLEVIVSALEIT